VQVIQALRPNFVVAQACMAQEFVQHNSDVVTRQFAEALAGVPVAYEPHVEFKRRVPPATGLIRTGDTIQYANVILESG
jgi:D-ribose pyranase